MKVKILVSGQAKKEFRLAFKYYNEISSALALRFNSDLNLSIEAISVFPLAFTERLPFTRWKTLKSFPYKIVYKINTDTKSIQIFALFHQSMDSDDESIRRI